MLGRPIKTNILWEAFWLSWMWNFRISFMITGHAELSPNRLFAMIAKSYYSADVFNKESFIQVDQQHSSVMFDRGVIVQCWWDNVTHKYSNTFGIHSYRDFLAIKNPDTGDIMTVRELCYTEALQDTPMYLTKEYTCKF